MLFNQYIWNLYKNSESGQRAIARFTGLTPDTTEQEFGIGEYIWSLDDEGERFWGRKELVFSISGLVREVAVQQKLHNGDDALNLFESLIRAEIPLDATAATGKVTEFGRFGSAKNFEEWMDAIQELSFGLYFAHPEYFLPYLYQRKFHELQAICEVFGIPLPPVPGKLDWRGRIHFYFGINQTLQEFRSMYGLCPAEMCAFLYDFAPEYLQQADTELPAPSKVWLITGGGGGNGDFE
jgi:hypothetical protein